jgi:predicted secreted protein
MKLLILLVGLLLFAFGMAKIKGSSVFVYVNTGTEGSPVWTKVGGQKEATFDRGSSVIDVTDKDSGGNEEHLPGERNWGISFGGFLIEDDAGWLEVEGAYDAGVQKQYRFVTPGFAYMGKATVESCSLAGAKGDAGVASLTLKGTGALTKTAI